jgi:hypothetical protein
MDTNQPWLLRLNATVTPPPGRPGCRTGTHACGPRPRHPAGRAVAQAPTHAAPAPTRAPARAPAGAGAYLRSRSATWNARSSDWLALSRGSQVVV